MDAITKKVDTTMSKLHSEFNENQDGLISQGGKWERQRVFLRDKAWDHRSVKLKITTIFKNLRLFLVQLLTSY